MLKFLKDKKDLLIKILEIVVLVLISLFCVISLYQKIFNNAPVFGHRVFVIVSDSMKPVLKKNDVILVKETKPEDIEIGDIITYQGMQSEMADKIITHEVVNITRENGKYIFYTRGRANTGIDPAVYEEQLYGVMTSKLAVISFISRIVRSTIGFILVIAIPLCYLFITEIIDVKKEMKLKKETN